MLVRLKVDCTEIDMINPNSQLSALLWLEITSLRAGAPHLANADVCVCHDISHDISQVIRQIRKLTWLVVSFGSRKICVLINQSAESH